MPKPTGTVYLIHFQTKLRHAQHYIGYTDDPNIDRRIAVHRKGHGAKLLKELNRLRIRWHVARVWFLTNKKWERTLKNRNGSSVFCPACNKNAMRYACVPNRLATAAKVGE